MMLLFHECPDIHLQIDVHDLSSKMVWTSFDLSKPLSILESISQYSIFPFDNPIYIGKHAVKNEIVYERHYNKK